MEAYGKPITPGGFSNVNLHACWQSPALPPSPTILAQMERRQGRNRRRELPWVACQWEFAGSSAGESCCLSLHFLSKATYLTPPLLHSYCQVTTPAHPLLHSQPLTQLKKARMTHRILLKCLLLPPKRCWVFIAESRIAHDRQRITASCY